MRVPSPVLSTVLVLSMIAVLSEALEMSRPLQGLRALRTLLGFECGQAFRVTARRERLSAPTFFQEGRRGRFARSRPWPDRACKPPPMVRFLLALLPVSAASQSLPR